MTRREFMKDFGQILMMHMNDDLPDAMWDIINKQYTGIKNLLFRCHVEPDWQVEADQINKVLVEYGFTPLWKHTP